MATHEPQTLNDPLSRLRLSGLRNLVTIHPGIMRTMERVTSSGIRGFVGGATRDNLQFWQGWQACIVAILQ